MTPRLAKILLAVTLVAAYFVSGAAYAQNISSAPCLPKIQWPPKVSYGAPPAGVTARYDIYGTWVCELPSGYLATSWLTTKAGLAFALVNYETGNLTKAQADADCATTCVAPVDTELAFIQAQLSAAQPKALVAFNGAKTTRSVYAANADGTLNPTPVANSSIAVASPCDSSNRLVTSPSYYSVSGQPNASAPGQMLGALYAVCVVTLPIGAN